jgi:hypothetical protein
MFTILISYWRRRWRWLRYVQYTTIILEAEVAAAKIYSAYYYFNIELSLTSGKNQRTRGGGGGG